MTKFHIKKDGTPGQCHATKSCPLGGADSHFDSVEAAQTEAQSRLEQKFGGSANKPTTLTRADKMALTSDYLNDVIHHGPQDVSYLFEDDKNTEELKEFMTNSGLITKDEDIYTENDSEVTGSYSVKIDDNPALLSATNKFTKGDTQLFIKNKKTNEVRTITDFQLSSELAANNFNDYDKGQIEDFRKEMDRDKLNDFVDSRLKD